MKTQISLVACAALLTGCVDLPRSVRNEEIAYQTLTGLDMLTTIHIANDPKVYTENNVVVGPHPTPERVVALVGATMITHYAVTAALVHYNAPLWVIHTYEWTGIGIEAYCVGNNIAIGAYPSISFHINR